MVVQREYKGFTRAEPGYGQFREPGGAVPRGGVCKTGEAPARVPRKARREGAGGAQRRATRFAEGWNDPPP